MSGRDLSCDLPTRRELLRRAQGGVDGQQGVRPAGLDYVEVSPDQTVLTATFIGHAPDGLVERNFLVEGGRRVSGIRVTRVETVATAGDDDALALWVDKIGDASTYTLRLVDDRDRPTSPPAGVDPYYDRANFSFKALCPNPLDCKTDDACREEPKPAPLLDYLAKDYASFRALILDRLALVMPDWQERHEADIGIALVELLAYVGDQLSYFQDAVATEAYLETAKQRISVRRHGRLVDFMLHEGCNARAWMVLDTDEPLLTIAPGELGFITPPIGMHVSGSLRRVDLLSVPPSSYEEFRPYDESVPVVARKAHGTIRFHTWGDESCCLPKGSTRATLVGRLCKDGEPADGGPPDVELKGAKKRKKASSQQQQQEPAATQGGRAGCLALAPGDFLVFEEVKSPTTGKPEDADPGKRCVVRLVEVTAGVDPLAGPLDVVEIAWDASDALPFPLCLSAPGVPPDCQPVFDVSVARGNVLLVDHGRWAGEPLGCVPVASSEATCDLGGPGDVVRVAGPFRPRLAKQPLTHRAPLPLGSVCAPSDVPPPAVVLIDQDPRLALPVVAPTSVRCCVDQHGDADPANRACTSCGASEPVEGAGETCSSCGADAAPASWTPRPDLLDAGPDDRSFAVETDNRGIAWLRFGNGELGRAVRPAESFSVRYRVGNGPAGNVGADAITVPLFETTGGTNLRARNPLAARGGTRPETLDEAKRLAPGLIRTRLERAVIADDYARLAEGRPAAPGDVTRPRLQRAAARLLWTGSWYEADVGVDPLGTEDPSPELIRDVTCLLERYRRMGHDLRVEAARYVPLYIALQICVKEHYLRADVQRAVLERLGSGVGRDGRRGFFHPDERSFGEGVELSRLVAAAQSVTGVASVKVVELRRLFDTDRGEIDAGILPIGPMEIAQLDSRPGEPDRGVLVLDMEGGR